MTSMLRRALEGALMPITAMRPNAQVAALCYRSRPEGGKEILLITSRDTGRWIIPKGWPIDGLDAIEAAKQEAWEEAGVASGQVSPEPLGSYDYVKVMEGGQNVHCRTRVFALRVDEIAGEFPEASEREREWMDPRDAAELVDEPDLADILRKF